MEYLDNTGRQRLGDALADSIDDEAKLSIIAAYFTVFAYGELRDELSKVDELRLIFSEPTFAKRMESDKEPREFVVSRRSREAGIGGTGLELTLRNNLKARALARECAEWARQRATFKTAKQRGMIGTSGSYHVANATAEDQAFMGSAANAFTLEGLGYERKPGVVTGVSHFQTTPEAMGLKAMFDSVWDNPALVEDVTTEIIERMSTLYRENSPEFVYFLTLYHLFRDFMEDGEEDPIRPGLKFEESVVWNKLYDFQKDAVVGAIRKLEKYKGCIIADSVGLGKTYEALAVIKYYEERNGRVLVLCPKRLRENWTLWTRGSDDRNPLADDRFAYDVLNHTDLSRYSGMSGDIDLEHLRWGNYDLLVIDESHNFRNKSTDAEKTDRYTRLIEDVIKSGVRTKVLMLSATPVNNKLLDLRNQIELITEGDDEYLADTDGIPSITHVTRVAQQRFIADKVAQPYNPGNRKMFVFSAFADTTDYLFDQLARPLHDELGLECAEVNGGANRTYSLKLRRTTFENILGHFSPKSKELSETERARGEIDIVFATDCISEGQNLQDCDCLVNYDIHWNPVRIIQRFGRIDRLGSENTQIQLVNFWPDIDLDEYIQLEGRVKGRMVLMDASATGEENVLEAKKSNEMNDLMYRRKQLEQLQSEVLDLEDISGGVQRPVGAECCPVRRVQRRDQGRREHGCLHRPARQRGGDHHRRAGDEGHGIAFQLGRSRQRREFGIQRLLACKLPGVAMSVRWNGIFQLPSACMTASKTK